MTSLPRLGKAAPRYDERTLKLAHYLDTSALPAIPAETNRAKTLNLNWPMYANDRIGDCTCAGMAHMIEFWNACAGNNGSLLTDQDVIAAYSAIAGYDPASGANDNGAVELDVLKWWQQTGIAGHRLSVYTAVNLNNEDLVRAATYLFDGVYIGVALPVTAQNQEVWDYDPNAGSQAYPGSWGGHCVNVVDYNATGPVVVTWGALKQMTWAFWHRYCDEAYAIISPEEFGNGGKTAEGIDIAALMADLATVTG